VAIAEWDRHGLERLVRYCDQPPLSQERLGRLDDDHLPDQPVLPCWREEEFPVRRISMSHSPGNPAMVVDGR
jgi:hypothetical protein